jgi:hypothetical protein
MTHYISCHFTHRFDSSYGPWLEFLPTHDAHTPLLDLVRCTVASRHLDIVTRSVVGPRLQKVAEEAMFKEIFNPVPSTESIYALLIMAFWSPVLGTPQSDARDGRLLVASAVSMAMNLRLNQASEYFASLQARARSGPELLEAMEKAQLVSQSQQCHYRHHM